MFKAEALEFPWVAELPKRERSRIGKAWDNWREVSGLMKEKGNLLPVMVAACLLDVSKQRVHQLIEAGKLEAVRVAGHPLITESSLEALCITERKSGRPFALPETLKESIKRARRVRTEK